MGKEKSILLGVNVDHVATVRQARLTHYPDPVEAGLAALEAGADSITIHVREDRRHIQEHDLRRLSDHQTVKVNLEMAATAEMLSMALRYRPCDVCLVPEKRQELTTEGGLDVRRHEQSLRRVIAPLQDAGIVVSLFIEPDENQIVRAHHIGAKAIELHTGRFAACATEAAVFTHELQRLQRAAAVGRNLGLTVNAGHGLNYKNVQPVACIKGIRTLNIGHAIVARALMAGMIVATREMLHLIASRAP